MANSCLMMSLPTGGEERGVLGVGSIPVLIPPINENYCIMNV